MAVPSTFERKWPTVILSPITVANSIITVSSTDGLHPKQEITLRLGPDNAIYEIKRILSDTQLQVGPKDKDMAKLANPIEFNGGLLEMSEQLRNPMGWEIVGRAVYEEEPAVALRNILVNKWGEKIDTVTGPDGKVRLGVDAAVTVSGISVDLDALTPANRPDPDNVLVAGSENGTKTGNKFAFVNNLRLQILAAKDRDQVITYADFGTKNQRITQIDYVAPSIGTGPGFTARKTLTYTLVGNRYRRDNITWSLI